MDQASFRGYGSTMVVEILNNVSGDGNSTEWRIRLSEGQAGSFNVKPYKYDGMEIIGFGEWEFSEFIEAIAKFYVEAKKADPARYERKWVRTLEEEREEERAYLARPPKPYDPNDVPF